MFAILAGLMAILVVLGATINSRFDGGSIEKALVGLITLPMLAFGNAKFSKGWLMGVASAALIGLVVTAGGMPLLFSLLFLGVALAAFWDRREEMTAICVVEEYLDDAELYLLTQLGEEGNLLRLEDERVRLEDEREAARLRINELEADNLRLVAQLARAPAPAEQMEINQELQEIFGSLPLFAEDLPNPQWVCEAACAS